MGRPWAAQSHPRYQSAQSAIQITRSHPRRPPASALRRALGWRRSCDHLAAMDSHRWRRLETLFHRSLKLASGERAAFLRAECAGHPSLEREVLALLAADDDPRARSAVTVELRRLIDGEAVSQVGRRVGPYRLIELLGHGGMGAVYLAERDDEEFQRRVAIKLLPGLMHTEQLATRLRSERQILASLEHPNIVRLLDGGTTDDAVPYQVMEYVRGEPITSYARRLPLRQRIALARQVCAALDHAHQRFIAHRDIKPSNILVDHSGTAKVLDFGIAALLAERPAPGPDVAAAGAFTPPYASPEQVRGAAASAASDVYSVGAVLYELCTGQPPLPADAPLHELVRMTCEVEPRLASEVAPPETRRALRGDLDHILRKCLHKDPAHRYTTIAQLSDDLARYLLLRPVAAHPSSLGYRVSKLLARHRRAAAVGLLLITAFSVAVGITVQRAQHARCVAAVSEQARADAMLRAVQARQGTLRALLATTAAPSETAPTTEDGLELRLRLLGARTQHLLLQVELARAYALLRGRLHLGSQPSTRTRGGAR